MDRTTNCLLAVLKVLGKVTRDTLNPFWNTDKGHVCFSPKIKLYMTYNAEPGLDQLCLQSYARSNTNNLPPFFTPEQLRTTATKRSYTNLCLVAEQMQALKGLCGVFSITKQTKSDLFVLVGLYGRPMLHKLLVNGCQDWWQTKLLQYGMG